MDAIVQAAMAKWPNVPDVYGWLALNARGRWWLRDAPLTDTRLIDFISRNYQPDARGRWHFQNGPQRVFVRCEAAPLVLTFDDAGRLLDHLGRVVDGVEALWLDEHGRVWLATTLGPASLDDRALDHFACELVGPDEAPKWRGLPLTSGARNDIVRQLHFVPDPHAD
jgi:hypothetical protein